MFGPWSTKQAEPAVVSSRKPGDPMIACIRSHGDRTFCGRNKEATEWVFEHPGHAVNNYDLETNKIPLGGLRACGACVMNVRAEWKKDAEERAK